MTRLSFASGFLACAAAVIAFASAVIGQSSASKGGQAAQAPAGQASSGQAPSGQSPSGQAPVSDPALLERVRALQKQTPLFDGHNDLPWAMRENVWYDFGKFDIRTHQDKLHTDIARVRAGGLGAQFWSVYVPGELQGDHAVSATLEQIDAVYELTRRYPDVFELARTADDVERVFKKGKIASLMGVEGGHSIDNSLATLRMLHRLGAGYMTLTHNVNTAWADAAAGEPKLHGLSKFGEEVVHEMNRLGMFVDLSHVSPDTMKAALRVTAAPVIFSHSSARALCDVPRNVPDDVLKELPKNGGVVMVSFVPGFTSPVVAAHGKLEGEQQKALQAKYPGDAATVKAELAKWTAANPAPRATLSQVADHIDHIKQVAGIDHVGIGSDFDGIESVPVGLEDTSKYPALFAELLRRGYSDEDVRKVMGKNVLRAMRQAETVAKKLQSARGPSLAKIEDLDGPQAKAGSPTTK
jgi:membrane dipeptidase